MICGLSVCCQFCKLQEQDTLKDLYNQDDDHQELANYYVTASYREKVRNNPVSVSPSTCLITYFVLGQTKPRPLTWTMRDLCVCLSLWSESKADHQLIENSSWSHKNLYMSVCLPVFAEVRQPSVSPAECCRWIQQGEEWVCCKGKSCLWKLSDWFIDWFIGR